MLSTTDDFMWYFVTVLAGLASTELLSNRINSIVAEQMMELTSRVEAVRKTSVKVALALFDLHEETSSEVEASAQHSIGNETDLMSANRDGNADDATPQGGTPSPPKGIASRALSLPLLTCALWISGEYAELIEDHLAALKCLVSYKLCGSAGAQVAFLSAILKIHASCLDDVSSVSFALASEYIESKVASEFAEVQERAWLFSNLLGEHYNSDRSELQSLFKGKLKPVDTRAQKIIPVPAGLDLDKPLIDTGSDSLSTYLLRQISNVTEADIIGTQGDDLFEERQFRQVAKDRSAGGPSGSTRRIDSPFFLGPATGTRDGQGGDRPTRRDVLDVNLLGGEYTGDSQTDAVAVLVPDDVPEGVDLTRGSRSQKSRSEKTPGRVSAALEEAFPTGSARMKLKA